MARVLVVDGANVVGSRADGWWKDRAGAAQRLHERLLVADLSFDDVVLVLEGAARAGSGRTRQPPAHRARAGSGDDEIVAQVTAAAERGDVVTVVTADRMLPSRVTAGRGKSMSPSWLRWPSLGDLAVPTSRSPSEVLRASRSPTSAGPRCR